MFHCSCSLIYLNNPNMIIKLNLSINKVIVKDMHEVYFIY